MQAPLDKVEVTFKQNLRRILSLVIPMAWSRFIQMIGWFVGMLIIAHLSERVLAASALINATMIAVFVIFMSLLFAMGVVSGRLFGERRYSSIGALLQQGCMLSVVSGLGLMVVFYYVGHALLWMGQPADLVSIVEAFFHPFAFIAIPFMLLVCLQQFCYGVLKQRIVIVNNIFSLIVFIPSAYCLVYGWGVIPGFGVVGLAYALMFQTILNLVSLSLTLFMNKSIKHFCIFKRHSHKGLKYIRQLYAVGWPMSIQFGGELIAFFVMTIFTGWISSAALASSQVTQQVVNLFLVPLFAVAEAAGILVSQSIGAKQFYLVRKTGDLCVYIGLIAVVAMSILFFSIPDQLTGMYLNADNPDLAAIVKLSRYLFYISTVMLLFDCMRNLYSGALRGFYDTQYPMWIGLFCIWVVALPLAYFMGFYLDWGVVGIRVGTAIGFAVGAFILMFRWASKSKSVEQTEASD